ncbi:MAG: hypothetical protein U0872_14980 [Planctomycetaceae bacterium]
MIRDLTRMMLAGWMAAVMTVSPLLAALECRQCCGAATKAAAQPACQHGAAKHQSPCCQDQSASKAESPGRCDHCPKCELKRPLTAVVSSVNLWRLPAEMVTAILPPPSDSVTLMMRALGSAQDEVVDLGSPPLRILFCVWRE